MIAARPARLPAVVLVALLAAVPPAGQDAAAPPAPTLAPLVTLSGADSAVREARCVRVSAPEAWVALWLEHAGHAADADYSLYYNPAGVPAVDFARCEVVAVFGGATANIAGYDALPAAAPAAAGAAVLVVQSRSYQTAGPAPDGGARRATPFGFFVVPRVAGPLRVEQHLPRMGGGTGRVIELARFEAPGAGGGDAGR